MLRAVSRRWRWRRRRRQRRQAAPLCIICVINIDSAFWWSTLPSQSLSLSLSIAFLSGELKRFTGEFATSGNSTQIASAIYLCRVPDASQRSGRHKSRSYGTSCKCNKALVDLRVACKTAFFVVLREREWKASEQVGVSKQICQKGQMCWQHSCQNGTTSEVNPLWLLWIWESKETRMNKQMCQSGQMRNQRSCQNEITSEISLSKVKQAEIATICAKYCQIRYES